MYILIYSQILHHVTSHNILTVLLKHLHQMLPYTQSFSSLTKPLLKVLLKMWSCGEEAVQVVSFLCILRIATSNRESVLETLFKVKTKFNSILISPKYMIKIYQNNFNIIDTF